MKGKRTVSQAATGTGDECVNGHNSELTLIQRQIQIFDPDDPTDASILSQERNQRYHPLCGRVEFIVQLLN